MKADTVKLPKIKKYGAYSCKNPLKMTVRRKDTKAIVTPNNITQVKTNIL